MDGYVASNLIRDEQIVHMGRLSPWAFAGRTGASHAPIHGVRNPLEFRRQFMQAQDRAINDRVAPAATSG